TLQVERACGHGTSRADAGERAGVARPRGSPLPQCPSPRAAGQVFPPPGSGTVRRLSLRERPPFRGAKGDSPGYGTTTLPAAHFRGMLNSTPTGAWGRCGVLYLPLAPTRTVSQ